MGVWLGIVLALLGQTDLDRRVESVLPKADEERWLAIPWQQNLWQARLDSQRTGRPMLIWVMDGNVLGCT